MIKIIDSLPALIVLGLCLFAAFRAYKYFQKQSEERAQKHAEWEKKYYSPEETEKRELYKKEKAIKDEYNEKEESFRVVFGFNPDLLKQKRYKQEILVRLGIMVKSVDKISEDVRRSPHIWGDDYNERSENYMNAVRLVCFFDPQFGSHIPHWTEFTRFVNEWQGGRFDAPKNRTTTKSVTKSVS